MGWLKLAAFLLGFTKLFGDLLGWIEFLPSFYQVYRVWMVYPDLYLVLPSLTKFFYLLTRCHGFFWWFLLDYSCSIVSNQLWLGFTEFYGSLPSLNGWFFPNLYLVLPSLTKFFYLWTRCHGFFGGFDSIIPVRLCSINFDWVLPSFMEVYRVWMDVFFLIFTWFYRV